MQTYITESISVVLSDGAGRGGKDRLLRSMRIFWRYYIYFESDDTDMYLSNKTNQIVQSK